MSDSDRDLRDLWQSRPQPAPIDVGGLQRRAKRLRWKVRLRNLSEWAAAAFIVPFFAYIATRTDLPWLTRLASVEISAAGLLVGFWIWRYGRAKALPDPSLDTAAYLRTHREQVLQQARLLGSSPRWYFLSFGLGVFAFHLGFLIDDPSSWRRLLPGFLFTVALFAVLLWVNQRAARRLRAEAEAMTRERV